MEKEDVTPELAAEVKRYREVEDLSVGEVSEIMNISMQDVTKVINSDVYKKVATRPADRSRLEARHSTGNKEDLVPFEEVITADPLEFEIEGRGKYWVHEIYCEDPECSCPGAELVFFKSDEGGKVFAGYFSMDDFEFVSESMRSVGEEARAVVEKFFENLTSFRKRVMRARYKLAKGVGEDPAEYIDFSSFNFDYCLLYRDVFRVMVPDVLRVEYNGRDYVIYDYYCCDPACRCNTAILNVFELKQSVNPSEEVFTIRVGLDGGYEIEERECEKSMVADFFESEIKGNEKLFSFLRYRYGKMKNFGREVQKH